MANVRLQGLEKRFGETIVVRQLDLEIADREFLTLLGPSGCGKSTVLNIVAGLEPPSAGRVFIGKRDVTSLEPQERDVAMVFQSYALYPHKTLFENIAFPLRLRRVPRQEIRDRVQEVAARLGLADLLDRRPAAISGGERQRVALGRALVRRPALFLLDEPLSNLDARLRTEMRGEIKRLHAEFGTTTLYVTHDQVEAMTLSDRVAVLREGVVQQIASPDEIYRSPANRFVASFVGTPGMNFLEAEVEGGRVMVGGLVLGLTAPRAAPSKVVVGVRPEDVELGSTSGASGLVESVESLGAETLTTLKWDKGRLVVRAAGAPKARSGETRTFRFKDDRLLLFEPRTGARLQ